MQSSRASGLKFEKILERLNEGGGPLRDLLDVRSELSDLIWSEIFHGDNPAEWRAALAARKALDDLILNPRPCDFSQKEGVSDEKTLAESLVSARKFIDLSNREEKMRLVDAMINSNKSSGEQIRIGIQAIINIPEIYDLFNDEEKAGLQKIVKRRWWHRFL
jgi:hypothetical protein